MLTDAACDELNTDKINEMPVLLYLYIQHTSAHASAHASAYVKYELHSDEINEGALPHTACALPIYTAYVSACVSIRQRMRFTASPPPAAAPLPIYWLF